MAEFDAAKQEDLRQIAEADLVAEPEEHHERDDVRRILSAIEKPGATLIELFATVAAPKPSVTPGRTV
jgi:hypothetical protein